MLKIKPLESINSLEITIQRAIHAIPMSDRYFIALSGGIDSIALLFFCLPYLKSRTENIQVIHINHGLSPNAQAWAEFCQQFCQQLQVSCHVEVVNVAPRGKGLEAAARKARYEVFGRYLRGGGVLLQGHHLNDQAETVLMRVFKGLGPEAITGIPKSRPISKGCVYRPWLEIPRALLESSVAEAGLTWVEDESNQDLRFERNYLRHDVLPILVKRRPTILADLSRSAKKSLEIVEFVQEWCQSNKHQFMSHVYAKDRAVDINSLLEYSVLQQKMVIRFWLDLLGVSHPSEKTFQRIFDELLISRNDSDAEICWDGYVLRVFDGALFCLSKIMKELVSFCTEVELSSLLNRELSELSVTLPSGRLSVSRYQNGTVFHSNENHGCNVYEVICQIPENTKSLKIRSRLGGEKISLNNQNSSALKKLYQSNKVLPWNRDKLPLIFLGDKMVCSMANFVAYEHKLDSESPALSMPTSLRLKFEMIT